MVFPFPTEDITEGRVTVTIPLLKIFARGPSEYIPSKAPVFYNPRMVLNRDLAVLALRVYQRMIGRELKVCDPLAGCGIRGIRFTVEVEEVMSVVINDLNPYAAKLASFNVQKNALGHKIGVENKDANFLLNNYTFPDKRFDAIDIDPYGSPSPFMDSALRALKNGGLLALTATDTAPLCGVNPQACIRKYFGKPSRTEYCHELAVRLLINSLVFSAAKYGFGINVLFSHRTDHYIRVYAQINRNAGAANEAIKKIGYVFHCFKCLNREWFFGFVNLKEPKCGVCGGRMDVAGPLWLGQLSDREFCKDMLAEVGGVKLGKAKMVLKLVQDILREGETYPTYYVVDRISERLGLSPPPKADVIKKLVEFGYQAIPTHFNPQGIKSNAPINAIEKAVKELASSPLSTSSLK